MIKWFFIPLLAWMPFAGPATEVSDATVKLLRSNVVAEREQAAKLLGAHRVTSAVPALIDALRDREPCVRREAAKSLGFIKDRRAVAPLIEALRDKNMNVRFNAAYALGELKDATAVPQLLKALEDSQWCVRDQAAWALLEIGDRTVLPMLLAALQEKRIDTSLLIRLLRQFRDEQLGRRLAALLRDPDPEARLRVMRVLEKTGAPNAYDCCIEALGDSSPEVRYVAVLAIARQWEDRARKPLEALVGREQSDKVRTAAEKLLLEQSPAQHLAAHWSFNSGNAQTAIDDTGRGNEGQIKRCTPAQGKVGLALQFGQGKYIEFGQPPGLPIAERPLTFLAWVKSNAPHGVVIARGGAFCGYSLYLKDGVAKFGIHRVQEGPTHIAQGTDNVVGKWTHLAGVIKQDRIELYVDGKLAAATTTPGFIPGNCGQGMEIGFDVSNSPAEITDHFDGLIDEVKIYQTALSAGDIAEEFRAAEQTVRDKPTR